MFKYCQKRVADGPNFYCFLKISEFYIGGVFKYDRIDKLFELIHWQFQALNESCLVRFDNYPIQTFLVFKIKKQ